jgi:hypothetical protein
VTPGLPEADRLLLDVERAAHRARLALHAVEDALDSTIRSDAVDALKEAVKDLDYATVNILNSTLVS